MAAQLYFNPSFEDQGQDAAIASMFLKSTDDHDFSSWTKGAHKAASKKHLDTNRFAGLDNARRAQW